MAGFQALPKTFAKKNYWAGDDDGWKAEESADTGTTDFQHRTVFAPTTTTDLAVYERAILNAQIATSRDWTPIAKAASIPAPIYHSCDRERLTKLLDHHERYVGHDTFRAPQRVPTGLLDFHLQTENIIAYFNEVLAAQNSYSHTKDLNAWGDHANWVKENSEELSDKQKRIHELVQLAVKEALEALYSSHDPSNSYNTERMAEAAWPVLKRLLDPGPGDGDGSKKDQKDEEFVPIEQCDLPDYADGTGWCDVEVIRPDLVLPQKAGLKTPRWKQTDAGAVIRRPERHCTDGLVFGHRRRAPQSGSVLIDVSGSMSLTIEEIEEMMNLAPGVNIATYCSRATTGYLTIVARGNKRCSTQDLQPRGGGNGIDGPALRWLAAQPGPRYWISDGYVTGLRDAHNETLLAECEATRRTHRITRLDSLPELIEAKQRGEL